jgi:cellulose synthase/poly-beta-1,6-N-acetylglucosamine synthase-like glycosyltransferase
MFETFVTWFFSLGEQYGVNPLIFGALYLGSIPLCSLAAAWLISNHKKDVSIVLPAVIGGLFFISAYLYLIIAGENVPMWVYLFTVMSVVFGGYGTLLHIRRKIIEVDHETITFLPIHKE